MGKFEYFFHFISGLFVFIFDGAYIKTKFVCFCNVYRFLLSPQSCWNLYASMQLTTHQTQHVYDVFLFLLHFFVQLLFYFVWLSGKTCIVLVLVVVTLYIHNFWLTKCNPYIRCSVLFVIFSLHFSFSFSFVPGKHVFFVNNNTK